MRNFYSIIIVDHVAFEPDYKDWVSALKEHNVFFVGVTATPAVLEERTALRTQRGDARLKNAATTLLKTVHNGYLYHQMIDTTSLTEDSVAQRLLGIILDLLKSQQFPLIAKL